MRLEDLRIKELKGIEYIAVNEVYDLGSVYSNKISYNRDEIENKLRELVNNHNGDLFFAYEREGFIKKWKFDLKQRHTGTKKDIITIMLDYNRVMRWQCEAGQDISDLYEVIEVA